MKSNECFVVLCQECDSKSGLSLLIKLDIRGQSFKLMMMSIAQSNSGCQHFQFNYKLLRRCLNDGYTDLGLCLVCTALVLFCQTSPCLLPEVAQVPYSFILQLRAEKRVGLGQNRYQPTEETERERLSTTRSLTLIYIRTFYD